MTQLNALSLVLCALALFVGVLVSRANAKKWNSALICSKTHRLRPAVPQPVSL